MAQTNYTPIILYNSGTTTNAPSASNLASGELAINYTDGKLFYKDNSSAIQVIGWKTTPTTAGGTGLTSYTAGDLPYYSSGSALSKLGIGTANYVLTSSGSAPQYVAQSTLTVGSATNATNTAITDNTSSSATWYPTIVSATTGNLPQTTSSTKLSFVPSTGVLSSTSHAITGTFSANGSVGTAGQVLTSNGSSPAYWASASGSGISWQSVQTSNFTASNGNGYPVNTTSGTITCTLPSSPSAGNYVQLTDYAGTFATYNLIVNPNGSKIDGLTTNVYIQNNRESIAFVYIDSTQGWIPYSGFQTAIPASTYTTSYLIVAGGGGGGTASNNVDNGGGGGAGGLLSGTQTINVGTVYSFTVGSGGATATVGSNSTGFSLTANGGGKGSIGAGAAAGSGGSGGGGNGTTNTTGGSGTSGQGNSGGNGSATGGGCGGGAGAAGSNYVASGTGGIGVSSSITGSAVYYGGGGGGSGSAYTYPNGGNGGGGTGNASGSAGTAGTANTGGGGGAGSGTGASGVGGAGGSGVVIISVPTTNYSGTTTGSPTITTSGSNTIIKFTSSGSYTG